MNHPFRYSALAIVCSVALLAGCAQQMIRDEATARLREGNYEVALQSLEQGLARYPDSPLLRAGLGSTRSEALTRLISQASLQRSAAQFDEAEATIQRGLKIDPRNDRLLVLQADIAVERRVKKVQDNAQTLMADGNKERALRLVESGLREAPRQPDLLAMQRRLELEIRLDANTNGRRGLDEARPITLDFRNSALSTVLEAITRGSGVNFILDRDVRQDGRVTVYLRNARLEDAIELVTGAQQLGRRIVDSKTVLIYPNTPEKQREHQEQVIRVFHLSSAEAKTTAAMLRSMLRVKEVFVDDRANMIVLRETPEIITLAERLVALQDMSEPEVMLEVEILEVSATRLTELGINFPNSLTLTPLAPAGSSGLTLGNFNSINRDRLGLGIANLVINLRREVGDVTTLANPRIRAKSREKARILIGDKIPIITTTTSTSGFVSENISYQEVGIKLEVESTVSPDDDVSIKMGLEVSSLGSPVKTAGGSLAYQIGTRNANTVLRLRDGETQLLGGLISNEDRSSANRVPGLGDLPVAGRLFSSQLDNGKRTELVLAITPRIIRSAPHPSIAQAEMWVGSELATRLRPAPSRGGEPILSGPSGAVQPGVSRPSAGSGGAPAADATVRVTWQAPAEVKAGEVFVVQLNVASGTPLRGLPLEIMYPGQNVEVVEVSEGSFLQQDGTTSFTHAVNQSAGRINVGILRSDSSGATGLGNALQLRLKARQTGPIDLSVTPLRPIFAGTAGPVAELPALRITAK